MARQNRRAQKNQEKRNTGPRGGNGRAAPRPRQRPSPITSCSYCLATNILGEDTYTLTSTLITWLATRHE